MEQVNDQRFDVEAQHTAEAIAIYKAVTGKGDAAYSREKSTAKWERAAIAASDVRRKHPHSAAQTLSDIGAVAACFGRDWPDVPGEPEILRRVKWAARQLQAARALPGAEPVAGQCRFVGDAAWLGCAAEHVRAVLAAPQDWEGYEVRYLYAEAQRPPAAKEQGLLQQFLQAAKDAGIERLACWCECCDTLENSGFRSRMSLCPQCGDKRCPRAYHHDSDCFASPKEPAP